MDAVEIILEQSRLSSGRRALEAKRRRYARLARRFGSFSMEEIKDKLKWASFAIERAKGLELHRARQRYFALDDELLRRRREAAALVHIL